MTPNPTGCLSSVDGPTVALANRQNGVARHVRLRGSPVDEHLTSVRVGKAVIAITIAVDVSEERHVVAWGRKREIRRRIEHARTEEDLAWPRDQDVVEAISVHVADGDPPQREVRS